MEWGVEMMTDDPVSIPRHASAKKNTTYYTLKPEQTATFHFSASMEASF